jgi:hypothetical protein
MTAPSAGVALRCGAMRCGAMRLTMLDHRIGGKADIADARPTLDAHHPEGCQLNRILCYGRELGGGSCQLNESRCIMASTGRCRLAVVFPRATVGSKGGKSG